MTSRVAILLTLSTACFGAAGARVFVEPFPDKPGAAMLREELVRQLGKEQGMGIATDAAHADFIIAGSGETYVRGYIGTNPRVHYLNRDAKPVYSGFLSVELKPRGQDTMWSYLATPRPFGSQDIGANLAGQVAHKIAALILKGGKP